MKQIGNWVFGSFFRTIGRLLVFVLLGIIISNLVDFGSLIDNFSITNLFFEKVSASSIQGFYTNWYNDNGNEVQRMGDFGYIQYQNNTNNSQWWNFYYNADKSGYTGINQFDYIEITTDFSIYATSNTSTTLSESDVFTCQLNHSTIDQVGGYNNSSFTCNTIGVSSETYENILNVAINPRIMYGDGTWSVCNFTTCNGSTCTLTCHMNSSKSSGLKGIAFNINTYNINLQSGSYLYRMSLARPFMGLKSSQTLIEDNTNAINSQTQQQQQQHNEVMDNNTTQAEEEADGFFGNFTVSDTGGLNAIITAPLNTIRSLLNSSCSNLTLPLPFVNKNITLPCLYPIYNEHFGAFFSIYQTIILAIISYRCLRSIFFDIKGFGNPDDDRIEVMDL